MERSALARHQARIGRIEEVLVEGPSRKDASVLTGRTRQNKLVHFPSEPIRGRQLRHRRDHRRRAPPPAGPAGRGGPAGRPPHPAAPARRLISITEEPYDGPLAVELVGTLMAELNERYADVDHLDHAELPDEVAEGDAAYLAEVTAEQTTRPRGVVPRGMGGR